LAFVYLAKFKWALFYLCSAVILVATDIILSKATGYSGLGIILAVICAIHAFRTSKKIDAKPIRKWYSYWWGVLLIPVVFMVGVIFFRSFLYEPFHIPSASMLPTLRVGNHIVISKWGYGRYGTFGLNIYSADIESRKKPNRGEVFVLHPPHNQRMFVERIIGLPNDVVKFSDKQLYINGIKVAVERVENSIIYNETLDGNTYSVQYINDANPYRDFSVVVPENTYFVMGDNRDNSADSRVWGMVPAENIIGKLVVVW